MIVMDSPSAPDVGNRRAQSALVRQPLFLSTDDWATLVRSLRLSVREAEVSTFILEGRSENSIAAQIGISNHTVHSHLDRLYRKLHIRNRCQLIALLFETYVELKSSK
jgi:DNA-binding CsgD family transcriptional regulator